MNQREIKYRLWDGKELHYELTHMVAPNGMAYPLVRLEQNEVVVRNGADTDVTLIQFTGLKDRNGKDIYGGDVLRLTPLDLQGENLPSIIGHVIWDDENARFIMRDTKSAHIHSVSSAYANRLEVLGNAYENPELLK